MRPIGLYLISGFLGAGKTTFLTHMLTRYTDRKVGVIVNEFGSVSIDGDVLERDGIKLIEINNPLLGVESMETIPKFIS